MRNEVDVLVNLLRMSLNGSILVIIIIILRSLLIHKLPKRLFVTFWILASILFIVPLSITLNFNLYSLAANLGAQVSQTAFVLSNDSAWNFFFDNPEADILKGQVSAHSAEPNYQFLIWFGGLIIFLTLFAISYFKSLKRFRTSLPLKNDFILDWQENHKVKKPFEVRISDKINTPLAYGIFNSVILLPKALKINKEYENQLNYVLCHEYMHIKEADLIKKLLFTAIACIHWFNPLVWVMWIMANRDIELACDEEVVKQIGAEHKSDYALTLIGMAEKKNQLVTSHSGFSKYAIKERVDSLMKSENKAHFASILFSVIIVLGFSFLLIADATYKPKMPPALSKEETLPNREIFEQLGRNANFSLYFNSNTGEIYADLSWAANSNFSISPLDDWGTLHSFLNKDNLEVNDIGFFLNKGDLKEIEMIRLNYGDWISEEEFAEMYPGYTFDVFDTFIDRSLMHFEKNRRG